MQGQGPVGFPFPFPTLTGELEMGNEGDYQVVGLGFYSQIQTGDKVQLILKQLLLV